MEMFKTVKDLREYIRENTLQEEEAFIGMRVVFYEDSRAGIGTITNIRKRNSENYYMYCVEIEERLFKNIISPEWGHENSFTPEDYPSEKKFWNVSEDNIARIGPQFTSGKQLALF